MQTVAPKKYVTLLPHVRNINKGGITSSAKLPLKWITIMSGYGQSAGTQVVLARSSFSLSLHKLVCVV